MTLGQRQKSRKASNGCRLCCAELAVNTKPSSIEPTAGTEEHRHNNQVITRFFVVDVNSASYSVVLSTAEMSRVNWTPQGSFEFVHHARQLFEAANDFSLRAREGCV